MQLHLFSRLLAIVLLTQPLTALAATRTWDGGGSDNNWSTAANWSDNTVPTASDIALFNGTGKKDATIDAAFAGTGAELRMTSANTGTITVGRSLTITGNLSLSGGTFAINGGNTVTVKGSWQNGGGTLTSNTGTVLLAGSGTSYVLKETGAFRNLSLDDGLVGHWRFDEATGTGAIDSSRKHNIGAYKNGAARTTSIPTLGFQNDTATTFDGVDDYVSIPNLAQQPPFTVTGWFMTNTIATGQRLWSVTQYGGGGGGKFYSIEMRSDAFMSVDQWDGSTYTAILHPLPIVAGQWYFFAATVEAGQQRRISVNGEVFASGTAAAGTVTGLDTTTIGALRRLGYDPQVPFNGKLDDIRVYNRALSHSEVQALYSGSQGTGSGRYTLGSDLTVNGNLNVYSGNLDASSSNHAITASGSFVNNARFTPRSGTVTLSGIGTHLKTYGTSLYNLAIAASKSAILRTAATVTNALTVNSASTFTLNGNTLTATNADITNASMITLGSGALLHRGEFSVSPTTTAIGNSLTFTLADGDQNLDGTTVETVTVDVNGEARLFTETTAASGVFQGTIGTSHAAPVANNGIVESDNRCGIFVAGTYHDPDDATDIATARVEVLDSAVPCEISAGGSGGRRIDRTTARGASSILSLAPTSSVIARSDSELCSDALSKVAPTQARGHKQIVALCRRRDIVVRKGKSAETLNERRRLDAVANLILGVIGRLKARM